MNCRFPFTKLFALFCASVTQILPLRVDASESDFQTEEYFASNGLDVINAASAYDQGFTGKGVLVGLFDTQMQTDHKELSGKFEVFEALDSNGSKVPFPTLWTVNVSHGTHVASIIAAKKDENGMHGVAFNSSLVGQVYVGEREFYYANDKFFSENPELRILNNSWNGYLVNKDILPVGEIYSVEEAKNLSRVMGKNPHTGELVKWTLSHPNSLTVVAAGNDGWVSPSFAGMLPRYYGSELGNWITVVSANPLDIQRTNGTLVFGPSGFSIFSNIARGAELFTITAPGGSINAADVVTGGYTIKSGTSMATPAVSGAAALVAEAFPWMTGKQLADTLLTTANSNIECPEIIVGFDASTSTALVFYYFSETAPTEAQVIKALTESYEGNKEDFSNYSLDTLINLFVKDHFRMEDPSTDKYVRIIKVTKEQIFGQGMLDVGKAVGGPARLDVNRMSVKDLKTYAELGNEEYVYEIFDTKTNYAVFKNDISERLWDNKYHHEELRTPHAQARVVEADLDGKKPGLIKRGTGFLTLNGTNTYSGHTVVEEGVLIIDKRADGSGGILKNSSVLVTKDGSLLGNGTVENKVVNHGFFLPGYLNEPFKVGTYVQGPEGGIAFAFDSSGGHNWIEIENDAKIEGSILIGLEQGFFRNNFSTSINQGQLVVMKDPSKLEINISDAYLIGGSPTIEVFLESSDKGLILSAYRSPESYSQYAATPAEVSVARALYFSASDPSISKEMKDFIASLDFSSLDGTDVRTALKNILPNIYGYSEREMINGLRWMNRAVAAAVPEEGVWIKSLTHLSNQDSWSSVYGYNSFNVGAVGGYRTRLSPEFTAGIFMTVAAQELKEKVTTSRLNSKLFGLGLEGEWANSSSNGFKVFGSVLAGVNDLKVKRKFLSETYTGTWTGFSLSSQLGTEILLGRGGIKAGPFAVAEYIWTHRPSVTEKGGVIPQRIFERGLSDFSTVIGLKIEGKRHFEKSLLEASSSVGWRHSYTRDVLKTTGRFKHGSHSFYAETGKYPRDSVEGALRLTYMTDKDIYMGADFSVLLNRQFRSFGGNFVVGKRF